MNENILRSQKILIVFLSLFLFLFSTLITNNTFAQSSATSVELNGDKIEYAQESNEVLITGNVVIENQGTTLYCDHVQFNRNTQMAYAVGNVRLVTEQGELSGDELTFDYSSMTGEFMGAKIYAHPYYGGGEKVTFQKDKIVMDDAYITTSDYDKPEYQLTSKRIDVYPGDKIVARHTKLKVSDATLMYLPIFMQRIDDRKPKLTFTPGFDSDWGIFLLSQYRYYTSEKIKGVLHVDWRELLDVGYGTDIEYTTDSYGSGLLDLYFTHERKIDSDRIWNDRLTPTKERDRYKIEWRHKWALDERTTAVWQYYKLSDRTFLKDFFESDFENDSFPDTFFVVTRAMPKGTLSLRTDVRVNRFTSEVERLPELRYDLTNAEILDSGFYFKNVSSFVSLIEKSASPSDVRNSTKRLDSDTEISYPAKVGILEVKPFVGGRVTHYTKTLNPSEDNKLRGFLRSGATLSTKFYRLFDVHTDAMGLKINRLRHIITPSVGYEYTSTPTLASSKLNIFDSVDQQDRIHNINFSLENKLQTKRDGNTVELLRAVVGTNYRLKEDARKSGFHTINTDIDFRPTNWMTLFFDSEYDTNDRRISTANFDIYVNGGDKWFIDFSKRFDRAVDDQITSEFFYRINPKWAFRAFGRVDIESGILKEQEYTLTRDLHSWEMDMKVNDDRADGTEVLLLFRLKAFPEIGIDAGTTFERRRSGSESDI